jgi:hypothetical protein
MASPSEANRKVSGAAKTATLVLAIFLCSVSCLLMLMLDPRSLAVDSVYQGF